MDKAFDTEVEARNYIGAYPKRRCPSAQYHNYNPVLLYPEVAKLLGRGDGTKWVVRMPQ